VSPGGNKIALDTRPLRVVVNSLGLESVASTGDHGVKLALRADSSGHPAEAPIAQHVAGGDFMISEKPRES
jgi:hypothetical protein